VKVFVNPKNFNNLAMHVKLKTHLIHSRGILLPGLLCSLIAFAHAARVLTHGDGGTLTACEGSKRLKVRLVCIRCLLGASEGVFSPSCDASQLHPAPLQLHKAGAATTAARQLVLFSLPEPIACC
jgi:hypothetical protein